MSDVKYEIVPHDGGWAYRVDGTYSETFPNHEDALSAAQRASREQRIPGDSVVLQWQDSQGHWHTESSAGADRPQTHILDRKS